MAICTLLLNSDFVRTCRTRVNETLVQQGNDNSYDYRQMFLFNMNGEN